MAVDEARLAQLHQRLKERDEAIRESWVKVMEARIVRDKLQKCYRTEGVNHMETCKELADKYLDMIKDNRVKGFKQVDV